MARVHRKLSALVRLSMVVHLREWRVQGQPELHSETPSQKEKEKRGEVVQVLEHWPSGQEVQCLNPMTT
jgi:hypothetical protein